MDTPNAPLMGAAQYQRPHYAPGIPAVIPMPSVPLSSLLDDAVRRFPDNTAVDFLGATCTYQELADQVAHAAEALRRLGIKRGDTVALILPNCPQHLVLAYAAWRIGAIIAEHNPLAPSAQIAEQLELHGGSLLIGWEKTIEKLGQDMDLSALNVYSVDLTRALPRKSQLALRLPVAAARAKRAELRGEVPQRVRSWDDLVSSTPKLPTGTPLPETSDVAALLFTGGTTGTPKAVKLTHLSLYANAEMSVTWSSQAAFPGQETFYAVLPFFHAFGLSLSLLCAVKFAATQVILPKFSADLVLEAWKRQPATFFPGVPVMFARIAARAMATKADLSSCKVAFCGAASAPQEVADAWEKVTGGVMIEGYGMAEASPIILGNPVSADRRPGALGVPFPSTDVRIVDPENPSEEVPPGTVGELIVHGPQVFAGYLNNPEETANIMLPGGWLRTGDLVYQDADGFYVMADRRKELIISGGFNIYPTEVEAAVRSMPQVEDVAVVGLPGESGNESVVAALVVRSGETVTLDQVREWAEKNLSHYALPRQIAIINELPRSQIGKVLRRVVREELLTARDNASAQATALAERWNPGSNKEDTTQK